MTFPSAIGSNQWYQWWVQVKQPGQQTTRAVHQLQKGSKKIMTSMGKGNPDSTHYNGMKKYKLLELQHVWEHTPGMQYVNRKYCNMSGNIHQGCNM